uniref:Uncharacterized protein n=1 Tax=Tanacetum cinerariifolium TaxID=118510 RepID=A0A6L2JL77_TANCI|nr:hypothetical protein [Tanacetum cinerariifolium]
MERGFLSQKGSEGRGVKEKIINGNKTNTAGIGLFTALDGILNEVTPVSVNEGVTPSVVDMTVEMENISSLEDTTILGSFQPLSTSVTTTAGNSPGKSSYANVTGKPSRKKLNIRTLFTPGGGGGGKYGLVHSMFSSSTRLFSFQFSFMDGLDAMLENGLWFIRNNPLILKKWHLDENLLKEGVSTVSVWLKLHGVLVTTFSEDGLSAIATKLGTPFMLDSYTFDMFMQSWGRSSYVRAMIELRADVELKDNIVKPLRCEACKVFRHIHGECPKNTGDGEKKTLKKPSQTSRELLTIRKAILMDEAGNPLKKVEYPGNYDSEDEVASIDYDMARSMASERVGFGTQSLLEQ